MVRFNDLAQQHRTRIRAVYNAKRDFYRENGRAPMLDNVSVEADYISVD